jgi:hypothetical protein
MTTMTRSSARCKGHQPSSKEIRPCEIKDWTTAKRLFAVITSKKAIRRWIEAPARGFEKDMGIAKAANKRHRTGVPTRDAISPHAWGVSIATSAQVGVALRDGAGLLILGADSRINRCEPKRMEVTLT